MACAASRQRLSAHEPGTVAGAGPVKALGLLATDHCNLEVARGEIGLIGP